MADIPDRAYGDIESRTFTLKIPGPNDAPRDLVVTVGLTSVGAPHELFVQICPADQRASANAVARLISKWLQAEGDVVDIISQLEGQSDPWTPVRHNRMVNGVRPLIKSTPDALAWILKEITGHPR